MPSEASAFVWTWLPGAVEPVVAGRVDQVGDELRLTYGQSYLRRSDSVPLQHVGLPLVAGQQRPAIGLDAHGVIRDAAPDSWGMQVILRRRVGAGAQDPTVLPLITYLLESGSNRIGALDFQDTADDYRARTKHGTLTELVEAGDRLARGLPFSPELDDALTYGTAIGGARPKALLMDGSRQLIAKFSVSTDTFPWIQAEAIGMELARRCGVDTAPTTLTTAAGRDVLLIERFDRPEGGRRLSVLSALTLLGLHELAARYGSYVDLAEQIRLRFDAPDATLQQLFRRLVVNVLVGNTDDHPRNHAAFWDGTTLTLTPTFDVCPQPRSTGETAQVMAFGANGERRSRLAACIGAASVFQLSEREASSVIDECASVVCDQYDDVCAQIGVNAATRDLLWRRAVANDSVFYPLD
ncbi:MAG TPA: HipA domain-containing protein [Acidimicrobiales bacterium]|nr:HipA domain-containing protein [Acidimicrobiales bacterium]